MDVRRVFPGAFAKEFHLWTPFDHDSIVRSFGYTVLITGITRGCSGCRWYLLKDGTRYGYLESEFSCLSCSGYNEIESCKDFDSLQKEANTLEKSIVWYDSLDQLKIWLETHNFKNDFYSESEKVEFLNKVLKLVGSMRQAFQDDDYSKIYIV